MGEKDKVAGESEITLVLWLKRERIAHGKMDERIETRKECTNKAKTHTKRTYYKYKNDEKLLIISS